MYKIKRALSKLLTVLFMISSVFTYNCTSNAANTKKITTDLKEQQIIIKYKDQSKRDQVRNGVKKNLKLEKLDLKRSFNKSRIDVISTQNISDAEKIITELRKSPYVEYAQRNLKLNILEGDININYDDILSVGDITETTGDQENVPGTAIDLLKAWELSRGSSDIIIAVVDTGIDTTHDDLRNSIYANISEIAGNGIDDDDNGFIDDINGWDFVNGDNTVYDVNDGAHGTMVSGLISAQDDGTGIAGIAPEVKILPLKFASESSGYTSDAIAAIEYAEQMGAQIVNCSWGSTVPNEALEDIMTNSGMLFVCAAGNDSSSVCSYPAGFDLANVISVGAVSQDGDYAAFSNYGDKVEIYAPGVEITSTIPGNKYGTSSGTSMAAPFVTGTAALLLNLYPELDAQQIANMIIRNKSSAGYTGEITQKPGMVNAYDTLVDKYPSEFRSERTKDEQEALTEEVIYIISNLASISDSTTEEKEKILDCYKITEASILEGEQLGNSLINSIDIARAAKKYSFSINQISTIVQQKGSILDACLELNRHQIFLERYLVPENKHDEIKGLLLEGYVTQEIQPAYIVSLVTSIDADNLLRADGEDTLDEILVSLSMQLTVEEIAIMEEIFSQYDIYKTALLTYMQQNSISAGVLNNLLIQLEEDILEQYNVQTGAIVELYEGEEITKDQKLNSPFNYKAGNLENISINSGSLQYESADISIPGRNGLDVNIISRYDSSEANLYKADYGVSSSTNYEYSVYKWKYQYKLSNSGVISDIILLTDPVLVDTYSSSTVADTKASSINGMLISTEPYYSNRTISKTFTASQTDTYYYSGWTNPYEGTLTITNKAPGSYYINSDGYKGNLPKINKEKISDTGYITSNWILTERGYRKKYTKTEKYSHTYRDTLEKTYREVAGIIVKEYGAVVQTNYYRTPHYYNKTTADTYQELHNNMGSGWSLGFSSIENDGSDKFLHLSNGEVHKISITSAAGDSNLKDYTLCDIRLENDNGSYSNGVKSSSHVLIYKNGNKEYFADDGRLLGIQDRFENTINFDHTIINSKLVISKITDTVGRIVVITYTDTTSGKKVVITAPDSTTVQYILEPIAGYPGEYVLSKKIDRVGRETLFSYQMDMGAFSYLSKSNRNTNNVYADLKEVTYPTGVSSKYVYEKTIGNYGNKGSHEYYRVISREELENSKSYNKQIYKFTNEYTGYGTCNDPMTLPSNYTYETEVIDSDNIKTSYTFNNKHLVTIEDVKVNGSILINRTQYSYDSNKLPIVISKKAYNKNTGKCMENIESYQYDSANYGDVIGYWDPQAQRNTSNAPTDGSEHKTIYAYNATYHFPISKTYKRDEFNTIMEIYTPTSDGKAVEWVRVYENNNLKKQTKYVYDSYGNIIEEWAYLDDMVNYIVNRSSYTDNNASGNGQLNGAYLTRKWVENVKDVNGTLVGAKSGNTAGVVDEVYSYNIMGNLLEKFEGNGNKYSYEYDNIGRISKETNPDETYKQWAYDDPENSLVVTDENSNQVEYDYDGFGNLLYVKDLTNNQILESYEYDEKFRIKRESNNGGSAVTAYAYTNDGRISAMEITDNEDNILYSETYTYKEAYDDGKYNRVEKTIFGEEDSPDISTVTYTNKLGQVVKDGRVYNYIEHLNTYIYNYLGEKTQELSARAIEENWGVPYTSKFEYNFEGKVTKSYDALSNFITNEYDALGRLVEVTDMKANQESEDYSTKYTYDALNRLVKEEVPFDGSAGEVKYSVKKNYYDRNNNITKVMSANNAVSYAARSWSATEYGYDNRNRLVKVMGCADESHVSYTQYYYDAVGNKTRMYTGVDTELTISGPDDVSPINAEYSVTKYEYDKFNNLKKLTDPLGQVEVYNYDYNGNLKSKTDRNGSVFNYTYDGLNRVLSMSVATANGKGDRSYAWEYALTGQKLSENDGDDTATYAYDGLGRLIKETNGNVIKEYSYDTADNRKSFRLTVGGSLKTNTTYNYDRLNRMKQVLENGNITAEYSYDANGNRETLQYSNGNIMSYAYNLANRLTELSNRNGSALLSRYQYSYYLDGNQSKKTDTVTGKSTDYTYDGMGRLLNEFETKDSLCTGSIQYTYDSANNRSSMSIIKNSGIITKKNINGVITKTSYEYDDNNRLLTETSRTEDQTDITYYYYDKNGNQICKTTSTQKTVSPTEEESITVAVLGESTESTGITINKYDGLNQIIESTSGSSIAVYTYNCNGLRTSKTVNGITTQHIWDGDQMVMELDGAGAVINKYVRGINLIYAENASGTNPQYYLFNGHGDVVQLTSNAGTLIKAYDYDAFGNEKNFDNTDINPFRYCGEYICLSSYRNMSVNIAQFPVEVAYTPTNIDPMIEFSFAEIEGDYATVTLQVTANENSTGQIFWRTAEDSFSEANSKKFMVTAGTNQYTVELGQVFAGALRLDVGVNGSPVTLRNIKLVVDKNLSGVTYRNMSINVAQFPVEVSYTPTNNDPTIEFNVDDIEGDYPTVTFQITANENSTGQIFWRTDEGSFSGANSKKFIVTAGTSQYTVELGQVFAGVIRLDVGVNGSPVTLRNIKLKLDTNPFRYCGEYISLGFYKNINVSIAQFPTEVSYTPTNYDPMIEFYVDDIEGDYTTVTFQITANENSTGQIFWRTDEGSFSEANSKKIIVTAGTSQYTVELGQVFAGVIRLDVGVNGSPVTLRNIKLNSSKPDTNPFRYCGEYFDKETGTIYLRARYYDPEIGRFISEDSVWGKDSDPLSLNLYTYCYNNPIFYSDPTGNYLESAWDAFNIGLDVFDIGMDFYTGDYLSLLIDVPAATLDIGAIIVPVVPGGVGALKTPLRVGKNIKVFDKVKDMIKTGTKLDWFAKSFMRREARSFMLKNSDNFAKAISKGTKLDVHHIIPLEWAHLMGEGFDPNMVGNLAGIDPKIHKKINSMWNDFRKQFKGKTPTMADILEKAKEVKDAFGSYYVK